MFKFKRMRTIVRMATLNSLQLLSFVSSDVLKNGHYLK